MTLQGFYLGNIFWLVVWWKVTEKPLQWAQRWRNHGNISFYNEWATERSWTTSAVQKKNKRNTVESRDIQLMFLSRSTKRPAVHDEKTVIRRGTKFHIPRNKHFCLTLKETPQIIYHWKTFFLSKNLWVVKTDSWSVMF